MANTTEKLDAFAKYDFSSDSRWAEYCNNITIPAGRSDGPAIVRRYKQKFYQKNIDPDFVVETLEDAAKATASSSSASSTEPSSTTSRARPSAAKTTSASSAPSSAKPRSSSSNGAAPRAPQRSPRQDFENFTFLTSVLIIVVAVVSLFPLTPSTLAQRSFSLCNMLYFMLSSYTIYKKYGLPRTLSLSAVETWLQAVSATPECLAILHAVTFMPMGLSMVLAVVPVACHVSFSVAEYLQRNIGSDWIYRLLFEKPFTWLIRNRSPVKLFAAKVEVSLGFMLIIFLFTPQRSVLTLFLYWQTLKLEFHSPATKQYHGQVWTDLGSQVDPVLQRYAPFLTTYLDYGKQWFQSAPTAACP